jgi:hypothetical protein
MKTDNGDIFTDFDVTLDPQKGATTVEEQKSKGTKNGKDTRTRYRARLDSTTNGIINGGGPEMQFTTFNGRIVIHKK